MPEKYFQEINIQKLGLHQMAPVNELQLRLPSI